MSHTSTLSVEESFMSAEVLENLRPGDSAVEDVDDISSEFSRVV